MNTDANEMTCGACGLPLYGAPSCVVCDREAAYARAIGALVAPKGAYKVLLASVGAVVAKISYNGRAWTPGNWPTKEILLTSEIAA